MKKMQIIGLEIRNIAGVKAFALDPEPGEHIVIGGANAAGKSSVLNAIAAALGGKNNRPKRPVHDGADEGETIVYLGEIKVKWRAKSSGREYLEVSSKDGAVFKSPQAMLSKLWGDRTFDPIAFFGAGDKTQVDTFAKLVGADLGGFDTEINQLTAKRRDIGRDGKKAQGAAQSAERHGDAPTTPVDTKALLSELTRRRAYNDETAMLSREITELEIARKNADEEVDEELEAFRQHIEDTVKLTETVCLSLESTIERLEREMEITRKAIVDAKDAEAKTIKGEEWKIEKVREVYGIDSAARDSEILERIKALKQRSEKDEDGITEAIAGADEQNSKHRANVLADELEVSANELRKQYSDKTTEIEMVKTRRAATIAAAPIPIDGLGIDDGALTFRDRPLDQCSTAEKLKIWFNLCLAEDPAIRIMPIDRWQDLDGESRRLVKSMADKAGIQIWTTVVGTEDEDMTVEIRDGRRVDDVCEHYGSDRCDDEHCGGDDCGGDDCGGDDCGGDDCYDGYDVDDQEENAE